MYEYFFMSFICFLLLFQVQLLVISGQTANVITIAGNYSGNNDGLGYLALFNNIYGLAFDSKTNTIYIADRYNNRIRSLTPEGQSASYSGWSFVEKGSIVSFNQPIDIDIDYSNRLLYVCDFAARKIRYINMTTMNVTTVDGFSFTTYPRALKVDRTGTIFVIEQGSNRILKKLPNSNATVFVGSSNSNERVGYVNGQGTSARFSQPTTFDMDENGNLYVVDRDNFNIRKITPDGNVTTFAGSTNGTAGIKDGQGTEARFFFPVFIKLIPGGGGMYITERDIPMIRKINESGYVSTIAGDGIKGSEDGEGSYAKFENPISLTIDTDGDLYVGHFFRIRKIVFCPNEAFFNSTSKECVCKPPYFHLSKKVCLLCPLGSEVSLNRTSCVPCSNGQHRSLLTQETCTACPVNSACQKGKALCPPGTQVNQNGTQCIECPAGFVKSDFGSTCLARCAAGSEPSENRTTCVACSANNYKTSSNIDNCIACPTGAECTATDFQCLAGYFPVLNTQCQQCPVGFFKNNIGNNACQKCPDNSFSSDDFQKCNACPSGSYLVGNSTCMTCNPGTQPNIDRTACTPCPSNFFKTEQMNLCMRCSAGAVCNSTSITCLAGYQIRQDGQSCRKCLAGYFKSVDGNQEQCNLCPPGTESSVDRTSCLECAEGMYRNAQSLYCVRCPSNTKTCTSTGFTCAQGYQTSSDGTACVEEIRNNNDISTQIASTSTVLTNFENTKTNRASFSWDRFYEYPITYFVMVPACALILLVSLCIWKIRVFFKDEEKMFEGMGRERGKRNQLAAFNEEFSSITANQSDYQTSNMTDTSII